MKSQADQESINFLNQIKNINPSSDFQIDQNLIDNYTKFMNMKNSLIEPTKIIKKNTSNQLKTHKLNNIENYESPSHDYNNNNIENITKTQNVDDIPIKPKSNNFLELLEQNLADSNTVYNIDNSNNDKVVIKHERFKKVVNVSKPETNSTKKYKYYSQNFDKNFESNNIYSHSELEARHEKRTRVEKDHKESRPQKRYWQAIRPTKLTSQKDHEAHCCCYSPAFCDKRALTSDAISRDCVSSRPVNPAITPSRSDSTRFWLTFHLPAIFAIGISTPTIACSCLAMKSAGASPTFHACA